MVETFWRNLPEEWLTFWENLPEGLFLPFAIVLFYWLGRHWTIRAAWRISISFTERVDEFEEKGRDIGAWALRRIRRDVASIPFAMSVTNGLLGAILAALIFR